jgi:hypothetical protein
MKYSEELYDKLPSWMAGNYYLLYGTGLGKFIRVMVMLFTVALFATVSPAIAVIAMLGAFWLCTKTVFQHVSAVYRYFYGATPSQLVRSYRKSWPSVSAGPVQRKIKVPHSQNTP